MKTTLSVCIGAVLAASFTVFAASAPRSATFEARHELKVVVPDGAKKVRAWFTMPQDDPLQQITDFKVEAPFPTRITTDSEGNKAVYLEVAAPLNKEFTIVETFSVTRREQISGVDAKKAKAISAADRSKFAASLAPNANVIIDDRIRKLAAEIVGTEKNPVLAARKLYDWTLDNIEYWVKDPATKKASPVGSTDYCLTTKTGNCTDFHSLWASLARASGIPTRIIYGSFFKAELDGQDADQSYHCWPEFFAPGVGWVPHDVAVADLYTGGYAVNDANAKLVRLTTGDGKVNADKSKIDYYFGNLDERRVTWSRGRDLTLSPKQDAGPVNALAKAYVEVDGKPGAEKEVWTRKLTFREKK
ncbi:MAG: transglutaminase domain-containing protein [Verrucomicrobia bacterium]|nr:transglutaminase domain-containing protein [Verrucomicrobiota bacterium]